MFGQLKVQRKIHDTENHQVELSFQMKLRIEQIISIAFFAYSSRRKALDRKKWRTIIHQNTADPKL